jgi:hypothetical protein
VGRSFKSWANTILELAGIENYLDSMKFGARTKSVMKDIYRAAKNGMIDRDCAEIYSKCPVSISSEPLKNTLINKMLRGSGHNLMMGYALSGQQHQQQKSNHENVGKVYGPFASQSVASGAAQSRESVDVSLPTAAAVSDKLHNNNKQQLQPVITAKQITPRPSSGSSAAPAVVANRPSPSTASITHATTKSQSQTSAEPLKSSTATAVPVNQKPKSRRSIANARFSARFSS